MQVINELFVLLLFIFVLTFTDGKKYRVFDEDNSSSDTSIHRLLIDVEIHNRPYALPYFLRQLEQLNCPCSECYLDLHLYHILNTTNENETKQILIEWVSAMKKLDKSIIIHEWTTTMKENRLHNVMKRVKKLQITFVVMFDSMIILLKPEKLLSTLIEKDKPLMTPLLQSTEYMDTSTFYLYDQTTYKTIYERHQLGCFLINNGGIKHFYFFNFQYKHVHDVFLNENIQEQQLHIDEIAKQYSIPMYVCNRESFGYIITQFSDSLYDESIVQDLYIHTLLEHQLNGPDQSYLEPIPRTSLITLPSQPEKTKLGLDEIYVINLIRRQDRRDRLRATFDLLNMNVRFFDGIDGKHVINQDYLENLHIRSIPNYEDPYSRRAINYGEIGCFLSHYFIWKDMIQNEYINGALILEDDIRFDAFFKYKLQQILSNHSIDWDLLYVGRKILKSDKEKYNETTQIFLIEPSYSHWTIGYVLSLRGAHILVNENPLEKILPVDEYLPIMYDKHPNQTWKNYFINRKLKAYAFYPTIVRPTHFFGEPNYVSDTENTTILDNNDNHQNDEQISVDVVTSTTHQQNIQDYKDEL